MKLLHISDLHLGIRLHNYDMREDQNAILDQIIDIVERQRPNVVVIAGDIYDKAVPSAEAVALFDSFVTRLHETDRDMAVMMISGNHDSPQRLDCYRQILGGENIYIAGLPPERTEEKIMQVTVSDEYGPVHFYLLPFVKPSLVRRLIGEDIHSHSEAVHFLLEREDILREDRNVLVSHQFFVKDREAADCVERAENEVFTVGNIDSVSTEGLEVFDYVALGHIHKPMTAGAEYIRYCGTPLPYSLSEEGQEKGVLCVTLGEKGTPPLIEKIPLKPLRQVRTVRGTLDEVLRKPSDDYVWVALTDRAEWDAGDLQARLYDAFPHLLGMHGEDRMAAEQQEVLWENIQKTSAMELFLQFCPELSEEEQELISDVIHTVSGLDGDERTGGIF